MLKLHTHIKAAIPAFFLLAACSHEETAVFVPIGLAESAVSDTSSAAAHATAGYSGVGNAGSLAIFGPVAETAVLAEKFLTADLFDNTDAKTRPDGLPDFAGETVMPVFDVANTPYSGYFDTMNEDYIRETAVRGFLSSVSDRCSSSAFDRNSSASKPRAKLFVLSSSFLSGYGAGDIEYIISNTGMDTEVLDPVKSAVSHVFSGMSEESNIGVWASGSVVSSGVYGNVFKQIRDSRTDKHSENYAAWAEKSEIVCLSPDMASGATENVRTFLDAYISADYDVPLSGVVIDDFTEAWRVDSLNTALDSLLAQESAESEKYSQAVAPGFRFVTPVMTLTADAYLWLRAHDRFTHLVAYPAVTGYMTAVSSEVQGQFLTEGGRLSDDSKFNRATGSETDTYRFIPLSQSCFTGEELECLKQVAPETYKRLIYVY